MLKNYFNFVLRNIKHDKTSYFINIFGLSITVACTLIVYAYVCNELSYDKQHLNYKRIYRIEPRFVLEKEIVDFPVTPFPFASSLKQEFPEIENYVRFHPIHDITVCVLGKENKTLEKDFLFTDSTVFDVFTYKFIYGSKKALTQPNTIVLTANAAKKYFGNVIPIGKVLEINGNNLLVTGVIEDIKPNSFLKFSGLVSFSSWGKIDSRGERVINRIKNNYWRFACFTFVLLNEGNSINDVTSKFPEFYKKYMEGNRPTDLLKGCQINAQQLSDIHLGRKINEDLPTGDKIAVLAIAIIGFFILLIGCLNYSILSIAKFTNRTKEIGIRKIMGATRYNVLLQTVKNTLIFVSIAFIIGFLLSKIIIPFIQPITGEITFDYLHSSTLFIGGLVIFLLVLLSSSIFPSLILLKYEPTALLKPEISDKKIFRVFSLKMLFVFQFALSGIILISTIAVSKQFNFMINKPLGFNKENILVVAVQGESIMEKLSVFKESLLVNPDIKMVSSISAWGNDRYAFWFEQEGGAVSHTSSIITVQEDFIDLMGIQIVNGRNFDKNIPTDINGACIINETAAKLMGWGNNAVGKFIKRSEKDTVFRRVIGVVNDFHYESLLSPIEPMVMFLRYSPPHFLYIKIRTADSNKTIGYIKEQYEKVNIKYPFEYQHLDETIYSLYRPQQQLNNLFKIFTLLSIIISCLGLFGISIFILEKRTKEIAIRRVNGASALNITSMLLTDFIKLVLFAFIIAGPIAYYGLNKWMQNFAYRTNLSWGIFGLAVILGVIISLLTVFWQSSLAARKNPSDTLKL